MQYLFQFFQSSPKKSVVIYFVFDKVANGQHDKDPQPLNSPFKRLYAYRVQLLDAHIYSSFLVEIYWIFKLLA